MKLKLFVLLLLLSGLFVTNVSAYYDMNILHSNWLLWTNTERQKMGAKNLVASEKLNLTALDWSQYSKDRGYIDHKRSGQKAYYDYKKISSWFNSKGVTFKKIKSITFSESIGWNTYSCKIDDCTDSISSAVNKTFQMYIREKGKKYRPHYNAMVNPLFSQIGVGIVLDETKHKYYITVHYGTEVIVK